MSPVYSLKEEVLCVEMETRSSNLKHDSVDDVEGAIGLHRQIPAHLSDPGWYAEVVAYPPNLKRYTETFCLISSNAS